jgi:hypothetical protein
MKNSTKRLLVSLGFLAIALIVTTTTTFAWFSFNNTVKVTGISATVTAQDGLYISTTENGVYGRTVDFKDCLVDGATSTQLVKNNVYELRDLSSADGTTYTKADGNAATTSKLSTYTLVGDAGTYDAKATYYTLADGVYTKTTVADADDFGTKKATLYTCTTANYIEFAFWLKSSSSYDVYLAKESTVGSEHTAKTPDIAAWGKFAAETYSTATGANAAEIAQGSSLKTLVKAENAARVSFQFASETATIWNPHADVGFNKGNLAGAYNDHINGTTTGADITEPTSKDSAALAVDTSAATISVDGKDKLGSVSTSNTAVKVTVRIWLEGKDGDCFNQILADTLNVNLSLYGKYLG